MRSIECDFLVAMAPHDSLVLSDAGVPKFGLNLLLSEMTLADVVSMWNDASSGIASAASSVGTSLPLPSLPDLSFMEFALPSISKSMSMS